MTLTPTRAVLVALLWACAVPAWAGPSAEAVQTCFADNTTGKDRKDLARWIFLAVAAHPEIRSLSTASAYDRAQSSEAVGKLFTRLVADACPNEIRALIKYEGNAAIGVAFEYLGRLAMQELTANREVAASVTTLAQYVDQQRIAAVINSVTPATPPLQK